MSLVGEPGEAGLLSLTQQQPYYADFDFSDFIDGIDRHLDDCRRARRRRERCHTAPHPPGGSGSPPGPTRPTRGAPSAALRLKKFFAAHAPYHMGSCNHLLAAYRGRTDALFAELAEQWGPEPDTASSSGDSDPSDDTAAAAHPLQDRVPPHRLGLPGHLSLDGKVCDTFGFLIEDDDGDACRAEGVGVGVGGGGGGGPLTPAALPPGFRCPEERAAGWLAAVGLTQHSGLAEYHRSLVRGLVEKTPSEKAIRKDMMRTFPTNIHYEGAQSLCFYKLHRVLCAASYSIPDGYCQSMNFIAGVLLLVVRSEPAAYNLLKAVVSGAKYNAGYYGMKLSNCVSDQVILKGLLETHPGTSAVAAKFEEIGVRVEYFSVRWFLCLFIDVVPLGAVLLLWDEYFREGVPFLFRFTIAVLEELAPQLLPLQEENGFQLAVQIINDYMLGLHDPVALIRSSAGVAFSLEDLAEAREKLKASQACSEQGGSGSEVGTPVKGGGSATLFDDGSVSSPQRKVRARLKNLFNKKEAKDKEKKKK